MNNLTHERYISFTPELLNRIKADDFVEIEEESHANRIVFRRGDKKIVVTLECLTLLEKLPSRRSFTIVYRGLSISRITLEFFLSKPNTLGIKDKDESI